ncbi:IS110 family transposase [Haloechinothrix sp. LS1_15]|uniref:IS110 family transposase n=1 Tax=Haloechinothrix sp. LS1_15 TaxID=2652248 RepID=UPI0029480BE8|nr:IS110 family transposase [Haloechinothrix sp. LS1_15]MDV6014397.1 IS110 family transposase [Haloechinothrix sp. LS1_15]
MMLIGIDPHKHTHTATTVAPDTNQDVASMRFGASLSEYERMLDWAAQWPQRRWAVENADGMGRHVSSWLLARGEQVVDAPPRATARVRQLSRGAGRKNDRIDAAAAACVAALQGEAYPLHPEGPTDALALLDERRTNISQARVRAANQLHALLRALLPGGAPRELSAAKAEQLLASFGPAGIVERTRYQLATDLIAEIRAYDVKLNDNAKAMAGLVEHTGSTLTSIPGVGVITAARLLAHTRNPGRFPTAAAFANYAGTAPIEIASAERTRHRLSRRGNRQLNSALHIIAITQTRQPGSPGNTYYTGKLAEGKTRREAQRCLKRRLANRIWRTMIADERNRTSGTGPGGHSGATLTSSAAGATPPADSSDQSLPGPVDNEPTSPTPPG